MANIQAFVQGLMNSDDKQAYQCLQQLEQESAASAGVSPYFDIFVEMLDHENSYVRTRGIVLIAANARWDVDYKIDEIIDKYLTHIMDVKPITARQCIKSLPLLVKHKPDLKDCVLQALHRANPMRYKESMQSLVLGDIRKSLDAIGKL